MDNQPSSRHAPFGWCFIGTGRLAYQVAAEILGSGRHRIVSAYSRRVESAWEFTGKFGGGAFETAGEAIGAPGVDGVYVVTPHNAHYEYVKAALELGKSVLCEKPFTTDAGQTRELFELAEEKGVYLAEAMWTWFSPVAQKVKAWLEDGEFGRIESVTANYRLDMRNYATRLTDPARAGGALLDIGVYPITYLYRLFGRPERVVCAGVLEDGIDLEENVDMTFPGGQTYRASVSMREVEGVESFAIDGTKAKIAIPWFHMAGEAKLERKNGPAETFTGDGGYLNEFDVAAKEIRSGARESARVPKRATIDVMEIMDACRRQMGLVYPFEK